MDEKIRERIILAANGTVAEEIIRKTLEGLPAELSTPINPNEGFAA